MQTNVGTIDRSLRIAAGLSLSGAIGLWGWIGVVPLASGLLRRCPAYALPGIKTCQRSCGCWPLRS